MSMKLKVKLKTDTLKPVAVYVAPVSKAGLSKLQGKSSIQSNEHGRS